MGMILWLFIFIFSTVKFQFANGQELSIDVKMVATRAHYARR